MHPRATPRRCTDPLTREKSEEPRRGVGSAVKSSGPAMRAHPPWNWVPGSLKATAPLPRIRGPWPGLLPVLDFASFESSLKRLRNSCFLFFCNKSPHTGAFRQHGCAVVQAGGQKSSHQRLGSAAFRPEHARDDTISLPFPPFRGSCFLSLVPAPDSKPTTVRRLHTYCAASDAPPALTLTLPSSSSRTL